jgi:3-methyladenine DNA glycosylase AlkD
MDTKQALAKLRAAGTAQNRKVYARHGAGPEMFGVSHAELGKLRKAIGVDHDLAVGLWQSGNHDARILAGMVADPARLSAKEADAWLRDVDNHMTAYALARLVAASAHGKARLAKWTKAKDEWTGTVGWSLVAELAGADSGPSDAELARLVAEIEQRIHASPNRVRYAMNTALIAIGVRGGELRELAVDAARRIGAVEVDHGETGCKTPAAVPYIERSPARTKTAATA